MLGNNIDPQEEIEKLPSEAGKLVRVVHVTTPSPLNPSHMPVYMASEAQVYIYEMLWKLRKKGFKDGVILFERGGEEGQVKETVEVIRVIASHLEKDVEPKELPLEFFGMREGGPRYSRQIVAIREHALDPLKGMLQVPEEQYTLLGTKAREKGKLEEWAKGEQYR
jgi:hypothetical protein